MNIVIALIVLLAVYAAYRAACDYVRRSMRSFESADRAMSRMHELAAELMEREISLQFAQVVVALVACAGCGCFIRGMMLEHYLPRGLSRDARRDRQPVDTVFKEIEELDAGTRSLWWQLTATAMIYDSFRNPLQGWFFRRMVKQISKPAPSYDTRVEATVATVSVLAKRGRKAAFAV